MLLLTNVPEIAIENAGVRYAQALSAKAVPVTAVTPKAADGVVTDLRYRLARVGSEEALVNVFADVGFSWNLC